MVCCLTAPSHNLIRWWGIVSMADLMVYPLVIPMHDNHTFGKKNRAKIWKLFVCELTHRGWVHICISKQRHHWIRSTPNNYLNQCWHVVNWILRNIFQGNFDQYTTIFIQKMNFKISSAKRRSFCLGVNVLRFIAYMYRGDCWNDWT